MASNNGLLCRDKSSVSTVYIKQNVLILAVIHWMCVKGKAYLCSLAGRLKDLYFPLHHKHYLGMSAGQGSMLNNFQLFLEYEHKKRKKPQQETRGKTAKTGNQTASTLHSKTHSKVALTWLHVSLTLQHATVLTAACTSVLACFSNSRVLVTLVFQPN